MAETGTNKANKTMRLAPKINMHERESLSRAAAAEGITMSSWLRGCACGEEVPRIVDPLREVVEFDETLRYASVQLRRIAVNVDQIIERCGSAGSAVLTICRVSRLSAQSRCAELRDVCGIVCARMNATREIDLQLRLTEAERSLIQARADEVGMSSSDYIRALIRSSSSYKYRPVAAVLAHGASGVQSALRGVECSGKQVNELAHRLNLIALGTGTPGEIDSEFLFGQRCITGATEEIDRLHDLAGSLLAEMRRLI